MLSRRLYFASVHIEASKNEGVRMDVQFEVGSQHENRKGPYEVMSITGDRMVIRWATGAEIDIGR